MIPGNKELPIESYLPIDRCAEGFGVVFPAEGFEFWGIPCGWYGEQTQSTFIEVRCQGKLIRTVNCVDISEINFKKAEDNG